MNLITLSSLLLAILVFVGVYCSRLDRNGYKYCKWVATPDKRYKYLRECGGVFIGDHTPRACPSCDRMVVKRREVV